MLVFGFPPFFDFEDPTNLDPVYEKIRDGFTPAVQAGWGSWFPDSRPVSDACRDFIDRCLKTDEADRLTCEEALEHPWLTEKQSGKGIRPCNASFINSLSCFKKKRAHLQEDLLDMLSSCHYLSDDQEDTLRKTFARMDKNGDGLVTQMELEMSLRSIDPDITEREAQSIMLAIDVNKDGSLDYHEVLEARINRKLMSREVRLRKLFGQLDQDGDGALNATELRDALNHVEGANHSLIAVERMMAEVDRDHDGVVEYEEFISMWAKEPGQVGRRLSVPIDVLSAVPGTPRASMPFSPRASDGGAAFLESYGSDDNPAFGAGQTLAIGGAAIVAGDKDTLISLQPQAQTEAEKKLNNELEPPEVSRNTSLRDIEDDPFEVLEPVQDPAELSPQSQSKSPSSGGRSDGSKPLE